MKTTGRDIQLTRQVGEHLVTAELARRGYIATPFAGNVPMFDILAANRRGHAVAIQVKTINPGSSWQFQKSTFCEVEVRDGVQHILAHKEANPQLLCVFVILGPALGQDAFYILRWQDLQAHFWSTFPVGSSQTRTRNPASLHCAIWPRDLAHHKDKWELIEAALA